MVSVWVAEWFESSKAHLKYRCLRIEALPILSLSKGERLSVAGSTET